MIILSLHTGSYDGTAALFNDYDLLAAVQLERLSRKKGDGGGVPHACIDEVLDILGMDRKRVDALVLSRAFYPTQYYFQNPLQNMVGTIGRKILGTDGQRDMVSMQRRRGELNAHRLFDAKSFLQDHGFRPDIPVFFSNHHFAHALSAFFFTDWDDALLYTADGCGDNVHYSVRVVKNGKMECLFGDDDWLLKPRRVDSLGLAYGYMTRALGFRMNSHEGKLTGLAAFGQPSLLPELSGHFNVTDEGLIESDFSSYAAMSSEITRLAGTVSKEDAAASIQQLLEDVMLASVKRLLARTGVSHLALAGGVFANVRLNRLLTEETGVRESFIFPGMGDEGIAVGGVLEALLAKDGLEKWMGKRRRLNTVFLGRDHQRRADDVLGSGPGVSRLEGPPAEVAASLLADGRIVAIYDGRMEFGPRALGARSILASPAVRAANDSLNVRLTRAEFMPFAPYVLAEDADKVFDVTPANAYACRFMTITCAVKEEWREKIPAVVHVDGTARPQIVDENIQPLYAKILRGFKARTGLPVLVNTSFNAHEEPIINTPTECLRALVDDRIDYVVTKNAVYMGPKEAIRRGC